MKIASHSQSHILIGESGHGGVDNCPACVQHFLRGVAEGQPLIYLTALVGDIPVFGGGVSEACRNDCDRRIIPETCSQGSDHCCLLGEKGRIPENRNGGLHSGISKREEAAPRVLNGSRDPGRFTCLAANSQENLLARCCRRCHRRIEKGPVERSLSRLQSTPV